MLAETKNSKQITEEMQERDKQAEQLSEERWDRLTNQSQDLLANWAIEALNEDEMGVTESLDGFLTGKDMIMT